MRIRPSATGEHRPSSGHRIPATYIPRARVLLILALVVAVGIAGIILSRGGDAAGETVSAQEPGDAGAVAASPEAGDDTIGSSDGVVEVVTYVVKEGDTLSSIAEVFNTSANSVAYINGILSPDRINIGQKLSVITNASGIIVDVVKGNTLSGISQKYAVPVDVIIKVNNLSDPDSLAVGQTLILPGASISGRPVSTASRMSAMKWPIQGRVTSGFGWRIHPATRRNEFHQGIDIAAASGTAVHAAASGRVTFSGWSGGYGYLITIDHGGGITTRYAHLSKRLVSKGDQVSAGQTIGSVGSTGVSTGPHLHFEVRLGGEAVNPRNYLP